MAGRVNVDNFVRAETDRMFADLHRDAGGVNILSHNREGRGRFRASPHKTTATGWLAVHLADRGPG